MFRIIFVVLCLFILTVCAQNVSKSKKVVNTQNIKSNNLKCSKFNCKPKPAQISTSKLEKPHGRIGSRLKKQKGPKIVKREKTKYYVFNAKKAICEESLKKPKEKFHYSMKTCELDNKILVCLNMKKKLCEKMVLKAGLRCFPTMAQCKAFRKEIFPKYAYNKKNKKCVKLTVVKKSSYPSLKACLKANAKKLSKFTIYIYDKSEGKCVKSTKLNGTNTEVFDTKANCDLFYKDSKYCYNKAKKECVKTNPLRGHQCFKSKDDCVKFKHMASPKFFMRSEDGECFKISNKMQPGKKAKLFDSMESCKIEQKKIYKYKCYKFDEKSLICGEILSSTKKCDAKLRQYKTKANCDSMVKVKCYKKDEKLKECHEINVEKKCSAYKTVHETMEKCQNASLKYNCYTFDETVLNCQPVKKPKKCANYPNSFTTIENCKKNLGTTCYKWDEKSTECLEIKVENRCGHYYNEKLYDDLNQCQVDHPNNICYTIDKITRECKEKKTYKRCDEIIGSFPDHKICVLEAKKPKIYFMPVYDKCVETSQDYRSSGDNFATKEECEKSIEYEKNIKFVDPQEGKDYYLLWIAKACVKNHPQIKIRADVETFETLKECQTRLEKLKADEPKVFYYLEKSRCRETRHVNRDRIFSTMEECMNELQGKNKIEGYFFIIAGLCSRSIDEKTARSFAADGLVFYNEKSCDEYLKEFPYTGSIDTPRPYFMPFKKPIGGKKIQEPNLRLDNEDGTKQYYHKIAGKCIETKIFQYPATFHSLEHCEENSDDARFVSWCPRNYHMCDEKKCYRPDQRCDKIDDCSDGNDEFGCAYKTTEPPDAFFCDPKRFFPCANGECLPKHMQCNQFRDCSDGSDEKDCVPGFVPDKPIFD